MSETAESNEVIRSYKPELVIGLVARMGVNTYDIVNTFKAEAAKYDFHFVHIKVTKLLKDLNFDTELSETSTEERFKSYIKACNEIRRKVDDASIFSKLTITSIRTNRQTIQKQTNCRGIIYVVDQLKRREEVSAFREVYGDAFLAVSCHAPKDSRYQFLKDKITADHDESDDETKWGDAAEELISMDEAEDDDFGQDVRSTFPHADFIIDATTASTSSENTNRLFRILFRDPRMSPTLDEYANNLASQASYRSIDLSRQVGAAILDSERKVLALGCNEVPKAGGGTYWPDEEIDGRDQNKGYDANTLLKRSLVIDIVDLLRSAGKLDDSIAGLEKGELASLLLSDEGALRDAKILDILEYGRALHAEMNAITDAARSNVSTQNSSMWVTTFPCHNCAKHIVGAGIRTVTYLEPYPKSEVARLYPDSVVIDPPPGPNNKVVFRQFCGVTKRRFHYFLKDKAKDKNGKVFPWKEHIAICVIDKQPFDYWRSEETLVSSVDMGKLT